MTTASPPRSSLSTLRWLPGPSSPAQSPAEVAGTVLGFRRQAYVVRAADGLAPGVALDGQVSTGDGRDGLELIGVLPPLYPEWLGDRSFAAAHGVRFPYVAGEMANGIATTAMVIALARADLLGFFGAGGLSLPAIRRALGELTSAIGSLPNWGVNLIHTPSEPGREDRLVDLLLAERVPAVSASAFMDLTPAVVRCAVSGLRLVEGRVVRGVRMFAKVSRPEVAAKFLSPAPAEMLRALLDRGAITSEEARLAAEVPLAEDITVEADSGGHTDNRPLTVILPAILALRDELSHRHGYDRRVRVGAGGGLGDPAGVAAAFAAGADYVVTGTINQRAAEAGLSAAAKELLAGAALSDVVMAPAADMFEYGVKVQVLRRGTMFAARAGQLYEAYRSHTSLDDIPAATRTRLERDVLRATFEQSWADTRRFWLDRDPREVARAEKDPKHLMALVFRAYLGLSSRWAIDGDTARRADYQIWCGPAIGAFNRWIAGTPLAEPGGCTVVQIARNLLEGAATLTRAHQFRSYGVAVPTADLHVPRRLT